MLPHPGIGHQPSLVKLAFSIKAQLASINAAQVPVEGATWHSLTTGNALRLLSRLTPPPTTSSSTYF